MGHSTGSGRRPGSGSRTDDELRQTLANGSTAAERNDAFDELRRRGSAINLEGRTNEARRMFERGEIDQGTFGQLSTHNFDDEILERAVERSWMTRRQANRVKRGDYNRGR